MIKKNNQYIALLLILSITALLAKFSGNLFDFFEKSGESHLLMAFFGISLLFILSFVVTHTSKKSIFPSFVVAIFFGIAANPLLGPIVESRQMLSVIVGIGATLILFGGGLETPYASFKKLIFKIASLSFLGLGITAFLFSVFLSWLSTYLGISLSLAVIVLLGTILASTDPAAIIPVLKNLRFKNPETKNIIISESAVTDVTGTLLTLVFLGILTAGGVFLSISDAYTHIFSKAVGQVLVEEVLYGVVFGFVGFGLLGFLTRFTKENEEESEADAAFFLFVPIMIYTLAVALGGSGYLAAFIAGLLFVMRKHLHYTELFFNHTIEGFLKPTIFVLLGALVDLESLFDYATLGILIAILFMFVIRPVAVWLSLFPFFFSKKQRLNWREVMFISFVRETGAIPAVLLVTVVSLGIPGLDGLVPIGMWVILATLIIEPPLTPIVARLLNVAEIVSEDEPLNLEKGGELFVVLGSRGYSFLDRLPKVIDWATIHHIDRIVVLHCLEYNYTEELVHEIGEQAALAFKMIEDKRAIAGLPVLELEFVSRKGFLQDNIRELSQEEVSVTAIFVGKRALDFRLEQMKKLQVPLFFLD